MRPIAVDISRYQNVTSFHKAWDDGIRLVIAKASQGATYRDPKFQGTMERLAEHMPEMRIGAYHFGDGSDVASQVRHFLNVAGGCTLLALDWEDNPPEFGTTMSRVQAEAFVSQVHSRTGRWPLLYSGHKVKQARLLNTSPLLNCELWLAQYTKNPTLPKGWKVPHTRPDDSMRPAGWRFWQYTNGQSGRQPHHTPGIGNCDRNMFPGEPADLQRWFDAL